MPTLSTLKIFISLFFQWVISSNKHIDIQVLRNSLSEFYYIFQIISFEIIPCFDGDCTSTLCVFNYCIPKIQHFSYEMMIVFHKTLFWNVVVWRMIEMKHFSFFSTLNCQKESIDGKYIFQGAIIFIILGKGVPKT